MGNQVRIVRSMFGELSEQEEKGKEGRHITSVSRQISMKTQTFFSLFGRIYQVAHVREAPGERPLSPTHPNTIVDRLPSFAPCGGRRERARKREQTLMIWKVGVWKSFHVTIMLQTSIRRHH